VQSLLDLVGGDTTGLQALIRSFLDESPRLVASMRTAVDEGDCELLRRGAHTLKSSARDFGASQLSALCQVLEATAKKGSLEGAAELLVQIEAEYPAVSQALRQLDPGGSHA
jgi:HPt (histidine-containing phosphotransfer) domain-containing protein